MLEVGYFDRKKTWDSGVEDNYGGAKLTLAHAISTDGSYPAHPEIRFFASYFKDNDGDFFDNHKKDNALYYGVQIEAWW